VLLPTALIITGVVRALWALRVKTHISTKRAILAFCNWLSLSWTVAIACVQGLTRKEGVFMRTPKEDERNKLLAALWSARAESLIAVLLWAAVVWVALHGRATPFVVALFAWQGLVYASAPFMSWLNQHMKLSQQLERRRRTERLRERAIQLAPYWTGALGGAVAAAAVAVIVTVGGTHPGTPGNPFEHPSRQPGDRGPLSHLVSGTPDEPGSTTTTTTTTGDSGGSSTSTTSGNGGGGSSTTTGSSSTSTTGDTTPTTTGATSTTGG
jgi:uncharacterized membrane protein YgcG